MPAHDWTRVYPGTFHDFHTSWISELKKSLNSGLLPDEFFALSEQHVGDMVADVLTRTTREYTAAYAALPSIVKDSVEGRTPPEWEQE